MKKILSLDGGGIKGVFPAAILATLEDTLGAPVARHFDLIVGTSTGGILALGLGLGWPARDMLRFYEELGPGVFARPRRLGRRLRMAKYDQVPLREALRRQLADRRLGDSMTRLVIPSFNMETGEVYLYKTAHHPRFERDYKESAVDVALATAAAPTYFPAHISAAGLPLVDGGTWANNPVGLAVVEALGVLAWPTEELAVLSIGCTTHPFDARRGGWQEGGYAFWLPKIVDLFMTAQASSSLGTAQVLIGHERVVRINPIVPRGRFTLDAVADIPHLRGLGAAEARKALPQLRPLFFDTLVDPFEPYHVLGESRL